MLTAVQPVLIVTDYFLFFRSNQSYLTFFSFLLYHSVVFHFVYLIKMGAEGWGGVGVGGFVYLLGYSNLCPYIDFFSCI